MTSLYETCNLTAAQALGPGDGSRPTSSLRVNAKHCSPTVRLTRCSNVSVQMMLPDNGIALTAHVTRSTSPTRLA